MTTRSATDFEEPPAKQQVKQTTATQSTNVFYHITVHCLKCSRSSSVKVDKNLLPDTLMHVLLSTRWDDRNWPLSEIGRPINNDPDDIEKKLMLQALIEQKEQFSYNEEGVPKKVKNTCIIPDILEDLDFDTKGVPKVGFLTFLNSLSPKNIERTVAKHDEILGPVMTYFPSDSIINYVSFCVFEEWIVSRNQKK